jgi:CheY-like chemotaxis protein
MYPGTVATSTPPEPSLLVLVVDDDPDILEIMGRLLEGQGHEVLCAPDVAAAFYAIDLMNGDLDLLVTDLMMPVRDGGDLIRAVRHREQTWPNRKALPIIAASAVYPQGCSLVAEVQKNGAVFLQKPFRGPALAAAIEAAQLIAAQRVPGEVQGARPASGAGQPGPTHVGSR